MGMYDQGFEELEALKALKKADLKEFMGECFRGTWSGDGLQRLRRMQNSLAQNLPPANASQADCEAYRRLVSAVSSEMVG